MAPNAKYRAAVALMVIGAAPFVLSEASYWWWLFRLPTENNVGMSDGMLIAAMRFLTYLFMALVGGFGVLWTLVLKARHPNQSSRLIRATLTLTLVALVVPLVWWGYTTAAISFGLPLI